MSGKGRVGFDFSFSTRPLATRAEGSLLRILVIADFAGTALPGFKVRKVDLDDLDGLVKAFSPQVEIRTSQRRDLPVTLSFQSIEDFHPDAIFSRHNGFKELERTRRELQNPSSFPATAARLLGTQVLASAPDNAASEPSSLFASLLGGNVAPLPAAHGPKPASGIDAMIARAIAPHVVPASHPQQAPLVAAVEASMADSMREILHAPTFARMERAWRGLERLVSAFPSGAGVELWVAAVPCDELLADAAIANGQLETSLLGDLVCGPESHAWSMVVVDHSFGDSVDDLMGLGAFAAAVGRIEASLVAGASATLAGWQAPLSVRSGTLTGKPHDLELAETWNLLRQSPLAPHVALVHPEMLLRLPYGPRRNEVHSFPFDELGANTEPNPQRLLWGSGAWAIAGALAQAFTEDPNDLPLGASVDIDDMPTLTFVGADGEKQLYPSAQTWITEPQAQALLGAGLIAMVAHRNLARVTLYRLQSIATPPRPAMVRKVQS